jgi:hypothetical protein
MAESLVQSFSVEIEASDIRRYIEKIIKVDQTDEAVIKGEIDEYIATKSIRTHFTEILEKYWATLNKPHEATGPGNANASSPGPRAGPRCCRARRDAPGLLRLGSTRLT